MTNPEKKYYWLEEDLRELERIKEYWEERSLPEIYEPIQEAINALKKI